jgi:ketosteroid isomerase-like protein
MALDTVVFEQQVAPLMAELLASANAHDVDRHCAAYAREPTLLFIANGEIIPGWDAYRERQRQWWDDGRAAGNYAYRGDIAYQPLSAEFGLTTAIILARRPLPDGQVREREVVFTALWNCRPEGWRITYAHESTVG